ncbi:MAG: polysaccharide biosynthesis/export family protein [Bacteroidaceae bacterium]|nr:polysaccharide biosynthesis/export family protein [Bacteroidaceae bacterium]
MKKIVKWMGALLLVVCAFFSSSCGTKKYVYLEGADTAYMVPKEVVQAFELQIQPDDELAIAVNTKTEDLLKPFNTRALIGGGNSSNGGMMNNSYGGASMSYFLVDKNGYIDFPVLGRIYVLGKTCHQLSQVVQDRLRGEGHILDAEVTSRIMNFKVTLLGDVGSQGPQTCKGERLTILEAIANAGGLNGSAIRQDILVLREENGQRVAYTFDINNSQSVFESPAYFLQQNDVIYVKPNKSVRLKNSAGYSFWTLVAGFFGSVMGIASVILAITLKK